MIEIDDNENCYAAIWEQFMLKGDTNVTSDIFNVET